MILKKESGQRAQPRENRRGLFLRRIDAKRLQLAVEITALKADAFGQAGDIAAILPELYRQESVFKDGARIFEVRVAEFIEGEKRRRLFVV